MLNKIIYMLSKAMERYRATTTALRRSCRTLVLHSQHLRVFSCVIKNTGTKRYKHRKSCMPPRCVTNIYTFQSAVPPSLFHLERCLACHRQRASSNNAYNAHHREESGRKRHWRFQFMHTSHYSPPSSTRLSPTLLRSDLDPKSRAKQ